MIWQLAQPFYNARLHQQAMQQGEFIHDPQRELGNEIN